FVGLIWYYILQRIIEAMTLPATQPVLQTAPQQNLDQTQPNPWRTEKTWERIQKQEQTRTRRLDDTDPIVIMLGTAGNIQQIWAVMAAYPDHIIVIIDTDESA